MKNAKAECFHDLLSNNVDCTRVESTFAPPIPVHNIGSGCTFNVRILFDIDTPSPVYSGYLYELANWPDNNMTLENITIGRFHNQQELEQVLCSLRTKFERLNNPAASTCAQLLVPKVLYFADVIIRSCALIDSAGAELMVKNAGPKVLIMSPGLGRRVIAGLKGEEQADVLDLDLGRDLQISHVLRNNGYHDYDATGFSYRPTMAGSVQERSRWANGMYDLRQLFAVSSKKDIRAAVEKLEALHRKLS